MSKVAVRQSGKSGDHKNSSSDGGQVRPGGEEGGPVGRRSRRIVKRGALLVGVPVEQVKGVGARRGAALRDLGVETAGDLLLCIPRRYVDRSMVVSIAEAPKGRDLTLICTVRSVSSAAFRRRPGRRGAAIPTTVTVEDDSDVLQCVWFQGGRYLNLKPGDLVAISGRIDSYRSGAQMVHPEYEHLSDEGDGPDNLLHTGTVVALYGSNTEMKDSGLQSRGLRRIIDAALREFGPRIVDDLPPDSRRRLGLMDLRDCLQSIHFPRSMDDAVRARRRLAFDELFHLQTELVKRRQRVALGDGIAHARSDRLVPRLVSSLPFELTAAQSRVIDEIAVDMAESCPMQRLLHSDVGSGKTVVALCAMLTAVEGGHQAALMAPTEILAEQHFHRLTQLVEPLGVNAILLLGGQSASLRRELTTALMTGAAQIAVGTHALIQGNVTFPDLGLVVVDEQHRFGVQQRLQLHAKGPQADLLVMTATPIPRSMALTAYGDLDVSVLDESPGGRGSVRTELRTSERTDRIFAFVADRLTQGEQAYIIYPLIEESTTADARSATAGFEDLCSGALKAFEVELLHGRMPSDQKTAIMRAFADGEIDALVSTTVVEVGVDVPNATVMVIEHAERFGLAQLHQLRGRVGRGRGQAYCILIATTDSTTDDVSAAEERLRILCETEDGFAIAQKDLELRGQGEVLGTRQAGVPVFAVADLVRDEDLLLVAREEAVRQTTAAVGDPGEA